MDNKTTRRTSFILKEGPAKKPNTSTTTPAPTAMDGETPMEEATAGMENIGINEPEGTTEPTTGLTALSSDAPPELVLQHVMQMQHRLQHVERVQFALRKQVMRIEEAESKRTLQLHPREECSPKVFHEQVNALAYDVLNQRDIRVGQDVEQVVSHINRFKISAQVVLCDAAFSSSSSR